MSGRKFRVLEGVRYPANAAEMRKKKLGEWPVVWVSHEPGEVVDDVPPESEKWLVADGIIEPVTTTAKPAKKEEVSDG